MGDIGEPGDLQAVLDEVAAERHRQDRVWGGPEYDDQNTAAVWHGLIIAYAGEIVDRRGRPTLKTRQMLIRVAALAVAALQCHDRRNPQPEVHP